MAHMLLRDFLKLYPSKLRAARRKFRNGRVWIKPGRPNRATELWYKAELLKFVRFISKETQATLLPLLKQETFGGDALPPSIAHQLTLLAQRFGNPEQTARRLSRLAVQKNLLATDKQLIRNIEKAIGINISPILSSDGIRDELMKAEKWNISLIKSIPEQYFEKLRAGLDGNFQAGERWEDLADYVRHVGKVTESRAKLIARDQTSKMNGAFNRARQTSVGIEEYKWQTSEDERVRPSHQQKDQHIYRWDSPPSDTGNPGDDVNCRCVAIPHFDLDDED